MSEKKAVKENPMINVKTLPGTKMEINGRVCGAGTPLKINQNKFDKNKHKRVEV